MSAGVNNGGIATFHQIGPLVDDVSPYSAIGEVELRLVATRLIESSPKIEAKPSKLSRFDLWQYGSGLHASQAKRIVESVNILVRTDANNLVAIRHLLIEGSSAWVIGRNITSQCSIEHIGRNALRLPSTPQPDFITMSDDLFHSYIPLSRFLNKSQQHSPQPEPLLGSSAALRPIETDWPRVRRIVDRVHKHVCGHASFSDMRSLLTRNNLWSEQVQAYLVDTVNTCTHCITSSTPPPNRRVSLASLDRAFNQVIAIDHFFLEEQVLFHAMYTATRYSAPHVVANTSMEEAIYALECTWISQFWPPSAIHADGAFQNKEFKKFLSFHDISLRPVPPRRHQKNMAEPRHGIIRAVYLRLRQANSALSPAISAIQAVRITNDLYGIDVASAFELAKGFTRPIEKGLGIVALPKELQETHLEITARRKLNRILHSHSHDIERNFRMGDLVQIYIKTSTDKRGTWTAPRQILSINDESGFLTVSGRAGKKVNAAFEDTRVAPKLESLDQAIQDAIDDLDERLDDHQTQEDDDSGDAHTNTDQIDDETPNNDHADDQEHQADDAASHGDVDEQLPGVGCRVKIFWPMDHRYYAGEIVDVTKDGLRTIQYDDNDRETVDLNNETWRHDRAAQMSMSSFIKTLPSNEQETLRDMLQGLGQRPFLYHHAQGYQQGPIANAYSKEEEQYLKHIKVFHRSRVPRDANIISSHVVYKLKHKDDDELKLKARIAPHGNEDSDTLLLKSDCSMCPPVGIRIVTCTATVRGWRIARIDSIMAFHQTGPASRQVFVRPPRESRRRGELWLLLVAGYGLINAVAKWQKRSDEALFEMGLETLPVIPQFFIKYRDKSVVLIVVKIVDDILITGTDDEIKWFCTKFAEYFDIGEVQHGPGKLRFFGLCIEQYEDFSCSIHCDDKLSAIEAYPLALVRRQQCEEKLNSLELTSFKSVNSSVSWIGTVASPLCAFYASYLQQKLPDATVHDIVSQTNALTLLKRYGTLTAYPQPAAGTTSTLNLVAFADASHSPEPRQLCYLIGLLIGEVKQGAIFQILAWASHKLRLPVHSTPAAKIMAASKALDELMPLKDTLEVIFGVKVYTYELIDSKDLYNSLSTQRGSVDKSIRGEVNFIRYVYETALHFMGWLRRACNPSDIGTKPNSPLTDAVILMLATGKITLYLSSQETRSHNTRLG